MQKAATLAATAGRKLAKQSDQTTWTGEPSDDDRKIINRLFESLTAMFPGSQSQLSDPEMVRTMKRTWLQAIVANGVATEDHIRRGLLNASKHTSPFLPSVGQFIAWCKPAPTALPEHKQLPKGIRNDELAMESLAEAMKILGKSKL